MITAYPAGSATIGISLVLALAPLSVGVEQEEALAFVVYADALDLPTLFSHGLDLPALRASALDRSTIYRRALD
jgi:hypothetical protein